MERPRPWHPFRVPGMCDLYKTICIMTLLSVTICLVILYFITGLKVLPTGDQTNNMMTQVACTRVCTRGRTRRGGETEGFFTYF